MTPSVVAPLLSFPKISWYLTPQFDAIANSKSKHTVGATSVFFLSIDYRTQNNPQAPVPPTHTHTHTHKIKFKKLKKKTKKGKKEGTSWNEI